MPVHKLRAVLTAIFLGTAAAGAAALVIAIPAQALTVSNKVGPLVKEAQSLAQSKQLQGSAGKVSEAEAVKSCPTTPPSSTSSSSISRSPRLTSPSAAGAKAKFANDYNAGKYKEVIADGEILRKINELDAQYQLIVAQAYYKAGDNAGCVRYAKSLPSSETALQLQARCAYETGDEATQRAALEQLVARNPQARILVGSA